MVLRFFGFLLFQLAGALAGWVLADWVLAAQPAALPTLAGAWIGAGFGAVMWFFLDAARGLRLLRWLKAGDAAQAPTMHGMWGEAADRARRLLRSREHEVLDAQRRLQEFLLAIQASPSGVVLLDAKGCIEWCNQTAAGQFGIDMQRDILQPIGNLVRDPVFTAYGAEGDYSRSVVIPGRDSTPARPLKLSVQLHPYGDGRRLLLSRDVTALEQAEAMRRDFVANVSHEIRTPLTVLAGFVETLQTLPLDAQERSRYLALMSQQAQRMQTLVNDLLTLSRLEGSPMPMAQEWTAMGAFMVQCEHEARALSDVMAGDPQDASRQRGHRILASPAPQAEIAGAPTELQSAFSNLVTNAVRYTPAGGSITLSWTLLPDGQAEFAVKDTGPGIAAEHIARLTERFYRVDRSRSRETGGTGLGLAIVKHVAQRHGAQLLIDSTPGVGSTFSLRFAASRIRPAAGPGAPSAIESPRTPGP
ncbi:MAG: phosphate regulon sensor histidine kinase PhoR [Burkholderiaceae bacterium]|nr:phosphate regulon sensor histidine kinase PhoR [Burkholderiaceae bacterium]MDO9089029.1 phosphate regulon sensor histidine kinase PhoR [Burkholderiaceae bacterium]